MASYSNSNKTSYDIATSISTNNCHLHPHHLHKHHHRHHQNHHCHYYSSQHSNTTKTTPYCSTLNATLVAKSSRRKHPSCNRKLISTIERCKYAIVQATTLTTLTLLLSGCLALTSAATEQPPTYFETSELLQPFDFAALVLEANAQESSASALALSSSATVTSSSAAAAPALQSSVSSVDLTNSSAFLASISLSSIPTTNGTQSGSGLSTFNNTTFSTTIATANSLYNLQHSNNSGIYNPALADSITNTNATNIPPTTTPTEGQFAIPPLHAVLVSIVLLVVILGTVVGNVLVCIAVCMVRKLRRPCNYLLVSLALSDLCVAVLVMPMALLYEVLEKWNFGPLLCDIWVSFDVLCCTASILNLCAISVDRYLAITKPLEYGVKRTPRRMMLCVALVWLAAACISLPPLLILGNEHIDENGEPICAVCQNFAYQIYATLGSFYIPLAVMLFVYYQIFRAARRIVLEEKRAQTHLQHALNGTGSPPNTKEQPLSGNGNGQRHSSYGNTSLTYSTCGGISAGHHGSGGGVSGSTGLLGSPHHKKLRFQLAKEKKASTTLGIIMSAFTICWLPFFILALIRPFVESETTHVPQSLSSLFLWLGYANSLLNPIIYATLNRDFRKPFQEILYFRCSSLNTMMRENYYQDQYGEPPSQRVMLGDERHGARESFL